MSIIQYEINQHEQQVLENIKEQIITITNKPENLITNLEKITTLFSTEIQAFAQNLTSNYQLLRKQIKQVDGCYISKLPMFSNKELLASKIFAFTLSKILGEPFQYLQQNNGEIVAEITPTLGLENSNSSGGRVSFGWHSDDCPPAFILTVPGQTQYL
jgi:hypothetical protein